MWAKSWQHSVYLCVSVCMFGYVLKRHPFSPSNWRALCSIIINNIIQKMGWEWHRFVTHSITIIIFYTQNFALSMVIVSHLINNCFQLIFFLRSKIFASIGAVPVKYDVCRSNTFDSRIKITCCLDNFYLFLNKLWWWWWFSVTICTNNVERVDYIWDRMMGKS